MGAQYKPVKGDRVRVVLEGEVTDDDTSAGFTVEHEVPFFYDDPGLISIEKIEPPVEVFKPGDVVRERVTGIHYALAADGWTVLNDRDSRHYRKNATGGYVGGDFTSEEYERVNLS